MVVNLGVSPTVKEITALAGIAADMSCCFFRGRAVVNDVNLVHALAGESDLVKDGVVINAVAVHPIGSTGLITRSAHIVDVQKLGMLGYHTVILLRFVIILDEMVPCMPAPNDFCIICADRLDFDDLVRPNVVLSSGRIAGDGRIPSRLKRFLFGALFPGDHQQVPVRHGFNVVMRDVKR